MQLFLISGPSDIELGSRRASNALGSYRKRLWIQKCSKKISTWKPQNFELLTFPAKLTTYHTQKIKIPHKTAQKYKIFNWSQ